METTTASGTSDFQDSFTDDYSYSTHHSSSLHDTHVNNEKWNDNDNITHRDPHTGSVGLANYVMNTERENTSNIRRKGAMARTLLRRYMSCATSRNYGLILACLVVGINVLAIPFYIHRARNKTTVTYVVTERYQQIGDLIVRRGISSDGVLSDLNSVPHRALHWVANEDAAQLDAENDAILERYALAVVYYGTTTTTTQQREDGGGGGDGDESEDLSSWSSDTNWLSEKGICMWQGIECHYNSDGVVTYDDNEGVTSLNLTGNGLAFTIPDEISAFKDLGLLDLAGNSLAGTIPKTIGSLKRLVKLYLGGNQLQGSIPSEILSLTDLEVLYLHDNKLSGTIPKNIGNMTSLEGIGLYGN
eukprot:CAMPEP_0172522622 /NCGR_PEP_ID=MMETSP1066-20121228/293226_1 /TAXON_ID=671091 /ORGANISM="Coscinodiscus wailesii, Strain CCMP2513" /LENGTH=359 /DNA_ID=CAMNT_0013305643 /DNA_START=158 /DNA_END=1234 /DNA_ORIENTATION=-